MRLYFIAPYRLHFKRLVLSVYLLKEETFEANSKHRKLKIYISWQKALRIGNYLAIPARKMLNFMIVD